ncbi:MAG TPA: hypothetical protein VFA26_12185 [Gemmataceae bacterium]|nr:hypothetical protein [Gemmataceae bacterium]
MIRTVVVRERGREVGIVQFFRVPVRSRVDYRCQPGLALLSEDQARQVAEALAGGERRGSVGPYEWEEAT